MGRLVRDTTRQVVHALRMLTDLQLGGQPVDGTRLRATASAARLWIDTLVDHEAVAGYWFDGEHHHEEVEIAEPPATNASLEVTDRA